MARQTLCWHLVWFLAFIRVLGFCAYECSVTDYKLDTIIQQNERSHWCIELLCVFSTLYVVSNHYGDTEQRNVRLIVGFRGLFLG